jgi:hypothetical protein
LGSNNHFSHSQKIIDLFPNRASRPTENEDITAKERAKLFKAKQWPNQQQSIYILDVFPTKGMFAPPRFVYETSL